MLTTILQSNCGIFPSEVTITQLPPNPSHIDTFCREINWVASLISSQSLGKTDLDSFVTTVIGRAASLESAKKRLGTFSGNTDSNAVVSKYWHELQLHPDNHTSTCYSFELSSLLTADEFSKPLCLVPSTRLQQECARMLQAYAMLAMPKKPKWIRLNRALDGIISSLQKDALKSDAREKPSEEQKNSLNDDIASAFAAQFGDMNEFTRETKVYSPLSAYLRETSCYIILSCLMARKNIDVPLTHVDIGLNKSTREMVRNNASPFFCYPQELMLTCTPFS